MRISDWGSDVCSSDLLDAVIGERGLEMLLESPANVPGQRVDGRIVDDDDGDVAVLLHRDADGGIFGHGRTPWSNGSIVDRGVDEGIDLAPHGIDRKSTRLNSSH